MIYFFVSFLTKFYPKLWDFIVIAKLVYYRTTGNLPLIRATGESNFFGQKHQSGYCLFFYHEKLN